MTTTTTTNYPYPQAQRKFIEMVRQDIDKKPNQYFQSHDWRMIVPRDNGKYSSLAKSVHHEDFYVRPMAVWLPHLLLNNFKPSCPYCKKCDFINMNKSRWQNSPKILYGLKGHRYLDTMLYYCGRCKRRFSGYNPESMKIDMARFQGYFNFNFSGRFAVDEELYSFITNSYDIPVTKIYDILKNMAIDSYFNDYSLYMFAIGNEKIKTTPKVVTEEDRRQLTIDFMLGEETTTPPPRRSVLERTLRSQKSSLHTKQRALELARMRADEAVCFKSLRKQKLSRNKRDQVLRSIGVSKLQEYLSMNIKTARQLLSYDGYPNSINTKKKKETFRNHKKLVMLMYVERDKMVRTVKREIEQLKEEIAETKISIAQDNAQREEEQQRDAVNNPPAPKELPPLLSAIDDKKGYNVKVLSEQRIECILQTHHQNRKDHQRAKMISEDCEIGKLDFSYKLPPKVKVYEGVGKCFQPYQCMVTFQNQNDTNIYYKMLQGSENIDEIEPGLKAIAKRNPHMKAIYVDNCCNVRGKLQEIFGEDVLVLLDLFHWMKRWEMLLADKNSEEAQMFRVMMCRSTKMADNDEFKRASKIVKDELVKKGKLGPNDKPPIKLVLKKARTVVAPKEILLESVLSMLRYCQKNDQKIEQMRMEGEADEKDLPKPFFKPMDQLVGSGKYRKPVRDQIQTLLDHIRNGCLSDPPGVVLHRENPETGQIFCSRGTSSCETDNLWLDALTGTSLGISRADRMISQYFEISNHRKLQKRTGKDPRRSFVTHKTEKYGFINSMVESNGYTQLPFDVCQPCLPSEIEKADIGFDMSQKLTNDSTVGDAVEREDRALDAANQYHEEDANVPNEEGENLVEFNDEDDDLDGDFSAEAAKIEATVESLLPKITRRETTMESFERLTNRQPWVPFNLGGKRAIDLEEASVFDSMYSNYDHLARPSQRKGYLSFMRAWNLEVEERVRRRIDEEDEEVILINRKSVDQLREYYKATIGKINASTRATNEADLNQLNQDRRRLREDLPRLPEQVPQAAHPTYPQEGYRPLGAPTVVNPQILCGAVTNRAPTAANNRAPFIINVGAPPPPPAENPLLTMNKKRWCEVCGNRRGYPGHLPGEGFGANKKKNPCKNERQCGKCYQLKKYHTAGIMGPRCPKPPHPTLSNIEKWKT